MTREWFRQCAYGTAAVVGSPWAFLAGCAAIVLWAVSGPYFHFSDTWQLVINTATTILTFLIVFLIQGAQNRDARALHTKLDAIIVGLEHVSNAAVGLERRSDEEVKAVAQTLDQVQQGGIS